MSNTTNPEFEPNQTAETAILSDKTSTSPLPGDFVETQTFPTSASEASEMGRDAAATIAARPRTRWAGIVWGTVFAAVGLVTMLIVTSPDRRAGFGSWAATLTPGGFVVMGVLALGCLILVLGLLAAVRRLQRRRVAS